MPLRRLASSLVCLLALVPLLLAPRVSAQDPCSGPLSSCIDANQLELALGPARFASLEDADAQLRPGQLSMAVALGYLRDPVVLTAASPDPEGRRVALVRHLVQTDLILAVGVLEALQLGVGLPLRVYQEGAGIDAATSRVGQPLRATSVADPRFALGWRVFRGQLTGRARLELSLPLGDADAFAGAPGPTLTPAFLVTASQWGRWHLAAEAGARLRAATRLGDVRHGHQLRFALGVRYALFDELSLGVEAFALPSLLTQPETAYGRGRHVPAEWLATIGSPLSEQLWLQLGTGSGLPLSRQGFQPDGGDREAFFGVPTPSWRALVQLRYSE